MVFDSTHKKQSHAVLLNIFNKSNLFTMGINKLIYKRNIIVKFIIVSMLINVYIEHSHKMFTITDYIQSNRFTVN